MYTDDSGYDTAWLTELFTASDSGGPTFTFQHVDDLLMRLIEPGFGSHI